MAEFDETEQGVLEYILNQIKFYNEIEDKAGSMVERWVGFKMGCTATAAMTAIRWAEVRPFLLSAKTSPIVTNPKQLIVSHLPDSIPILKFV